MNAFYVNSWFMLGLLLGTDNCGAKHWYPLSVCVFFLKNSQTLSMTLKQKHPHLIYFICFFTFLVIQHQTQDWGEKAQLTGSRWERDLNITKLFWNKNVGHVVLSSSSRHGASQGGRSYLEVPWHLGPHQATRIRWVTHQCSSPPNPWSKLPLPLTAVCQTSKSSMDHETYEIVCSTSSAASRPCSLSRSTRISLPICAEGPAKSSNRRCSLKCEEREESPGHEAKRQSEDCNWLYLHGPNGQNIIKKGGNMNQYTTLTNGQIKLWWNQTIKLWANVIYTGTLNYYASPNQWYVFSTNNASNSWFINEVSYQLISNFT